ncbi:LicD family protein [Mycoplasma todarodis]|uniref:LicD family protein n=1 Tax=Mycoplasma todarodis TaxID=1937191 RepID=UPI003B3416B0
MTNRKKQLINHLKTFINICEDNDIWYAAASTTLQGAVAMKGMIPWNEKIEIMMTIESYRKLKDSAEEYLIDGSMDSSYPSINPKFIPKGLKFFETSIFIDILIIAPTTTKKVKKWSKFSHKNNFLMKKLHSKYTPYNAKEKMLKFFSFPFKNLYKQLTFKTAYNNLYAKKNEGFYLIHKPSCKAFQHWIPHLTLNVEQAEYEGIQINIPAEYKTALEVKYGKNYKKLTKQKPIAEYIDSVSMRKIGKQK